MKLGRGSPNTVAPMLETLFAGLGTRLGVAPAENGQGGAPAAERHAKRCSRTAPTGHVSTIAAPSSSVARQPPGRSLVGGAAGGYVPGLENISRAEDLASSAVRGALRAKGELGRSAPTQGQASVGIGSSYVKPGARQSVTYWRANCPGESRAWRVDDLRQPAFASKAVTPQVGPAAVCKTSWLETVKGIARTAWLLVGVRSVIYL